MPKRCAGGCGSTDLSYDGEYCSFACMALHRKHRISEEVKNLPPRPPKKKRRRREAD